MQQVEMKTKYVMAAIMWLNIVDLCQATVLALWLLLFPSEMAAPLCQAPSKVIVETDSSVSY